jgi:GNAT superfamily N-acetyltransferase
VAWPPLVVITFIDRNRGFGISVADKGMGVSHRGRWQMSELTIRDMEQDEDFAAWFSEILEQQEEDPGGWSSALDERYLILSNEIGDWIGGLRFWLRAGVAHLVDIVVLPQERHKGHAHRLLSAFEERATEAGAHLAEFWTDDTRAEGLLAAQGWRRIFQRNGYLGRRTWSLMEKKLGPAGS